MTSSHRIAFLGAGSMTEKHAANLSRFSDHSIVSICSPHPEKAEKLASKLSLDVAIHRDFSDMLSRESFDILFICIPPFAHQGQLEAAAQKGIHVFIEKPIALTRERAASMVHAADKAGIVTSVGHHLRFGHAVKKLKALIASGKAGKPVLFDGQYACNALHASWWRDRSLSGGQVFEQAIHLYDMAAYLMGDPKEVCGKTANLCHQSQPDYSVEDCSVANLTFKSGALGTICATNCAVPGIWHDEMTVVLENLTARFQNANQAEFYHTGSQPVQKERITGSHDPYQEELKDFLAAIDGKSSSSVPISDGARSLRMVAAVVDSANQGGQPVTL